MSKILMHEYAGYAFPIELSRELARRGHDVLHAYSESVQSPKGDLTTKADDPKSLQFRGIDIGGPIKKDSFLKRRFQEIKHGRMTADIIEDFRPDIVISADTPIDAQVLIINCCRKNDIAFVNWIQDAYGTAVHEILSKKIPILGSIVGKYYINLENEHIRNSDGLVVITEDFIELCRKAEGNLERLCVIPNWAPIQEIPIVPKNNEWAVKHTLESKFCFVYSGTLGLKHNPELLLELAKAFSNQADVRVVVVSTGLGANWLKSHPDAPNNLQVIDFQPYRELPNILGTANVLISILEPSAGKYSVPSKVLAYHCAQRPLLLAIPENNLAARTVAKNGGGLCSAPGDVESFITNARRFYENAEFSDECALKSRSYAEENFLIEPIADQFEQLLNKLHS